MYLGKIVELSSAEELYNNPLHPYSKALISAIPVVDSNSKFGRKRIILEGDVPDPANPPNGCPFHPRCKEALEECKHNVPQLKKSYFPVVKSIMYLVIYIKKEFV